MAKVLRLSPVPSASDPALLLRIISLVAGGMRHGEEIAEALDVSLLEAQNYLDAGGWLGLLERSAEAQLTPRGMTLAFADPRRRTRLLAQAIWQTPFAAALLAGRRSPPAVEEISARLVELQPTLSPARARTAATSLQQLLAPALRFPPSKRLPRGDQLPLPLFTTPPPAEPPPPPSLAPAPTPAPRARGPQGSAPSLASYSALLNALLDHGELEERGLEQVLLGLTGRPERTGPLMELALERGDACHVGGALVASRGALARRALAGRLRWLALSDPHYRARLAQPAAPADDRYSEWDALFDRAGGDLAAELEAVPPAGEAGPPFPAGHRPFLECLQSAPLVLALPSSLAELSGGLRAINAQLRALQSDGARARVSDPRVAVHGGLLHPGERPPRSIPDTLTLRLRALSHTPGLALLAALLLADRQLDGRLRIDLADQRPGLRWRRRPRQPLLEAMEAFCQHQGWILMRPATGGETGAGLVAAAEALGVTGKVGKRLVLDEGLFVRLQEDVEHNLTLEALEPLVLRWRRWLEADLPGLGVAKDSELD